MNTPKRTLEPKRFNIEQWKEAFWPGASERVGEYSMALDDQEAGLQFALMVSEFTHLEADLERFAARVLGTDEITASHIMRAIVAAKTRLDLLQNVLERSRRNVGKPVAFDEIIADFRRLNAARNSFVHASYQTRMQPFELQWSSPRDDKMLLGCAAYEPFDVGSLKRFREGMSTLSIKIAYQVALDIEREQQGD
jgi:hypothetical protein